MVSELNLLGSLAVVCLLSHFKYSNTLHDQTNWTVEAIIIIS